MNKKIKCEKCNDKYYVKYGLLSERTSCRSHFYIEDVCRDCKRNKNSRFVENCYHKTTVKKCPCIIM